MTSETQRYRDEVRKRMKEEQALMEAQGYERRIYFNGPFCGWGWFPLPIWRRIWNRWRHRNR